MGSFSGWECRCSVSYIIHILDVARELFLCGWAMRGAVLCCCETATFEWGFLASEIESEEYNKRTSIGILSKRKQHEQVYLDHQEVQPAQLFL